ncbi:MAG: hypothetical protein R3B84_22860 [Zavarzinella sp.]
MFSSIFFDFTLPNSVTWFYFSFFLVITLFFRFKNIFSLRNLDLLLLYSIAPGLLMLHQAHNYLRTGGPPASIQVSYIWLLGGSALVFLRTVLDLGLEKRPLIRPNLNKQALLCLTIVLFVGLCVVAIRRIPDSPVDVGKSLPTFEKVQNNAMNVVSNTTRIVNLSEATTRFWVERIVVMILHLGVSVLLVQIGVRHFHSRASGMSMACLYMLLPYTAYHVSQVHHVLPMIFVLAAIYWSNYPSLAGAMMGIACGSMIFPVLAFPLWLGYYRGRGFLRFLLGFLISSVLMLIVTSLILFLTGSLRDYLSVHQYIVDWKGWQAPTTESIWRGSHWAYRLPVMILYGAFIVLTMFWPTPRTLAQVVAQTGAVFVGVQFWYSDQGGVYVLWYLPLLLIVVFRCDPVREPSSEQETASTPPYQKSLLRGRRSRKNHPTTGVI